MGRSMDAIKACKNCYWAEPIEWCNRYIDKNKCHCTNWDAPDGKPPLGCGGGSCKRLVDVDFVCSYWEQRKPLTSTIYDV